MKEKIKRKYGVSAAAKNGGGRRRKAEE